MTKRKTTTKRKTGAKPKSKSKSASRSSPGPTATAIAPSPPVRPAPEETQDRGRGRLVFVFGALMLLVIGYAMATRISQNESAGGPPAVAAAATSSLQPSATPSATIAPTKPPTPTPDPAVVAKRVGLISGHRNNDVGSLCDDGYTEAQLTFDVAQRVAQSLRAMGFNAEILDEFDAKLPGYNSAVFLSIHADSCTYINDLATGFKTARSELSVIPEEEDRLLTCLNENYKRATGLKFNATTITHAMTDYHAFRKINPSTPAAIIEIGFMNLDRQLLTKKTDVVAKGIVDGLVCFVKK